MLIDMDGNKVKDVHETEELKAQAIDMLHYQIKEAQNMLKTFSKKLQDTGHFDCLCDALSIPISEFDERCEQLNTIIDNGIIFTVDILGIEHEEDYKDMRKDLLLEMMYFIETSNKKRNK